MQIYKSDYRLHGNKLTTLRADVSVDAWFTMFTLRAHLLNLAS